MRKNSGTEGGTMVASDADQAVFSEHSTPPSNTSERESADAERIQQFLIELGLDDGAVRERVADAGSYQKEVLRRSAINARETLAGYLKVETQDGWLDVNSRQQEANVQWVTVTRPIIEHLLRQAGSEENTDEIFSSTDPEQPVTKDTILSAVERRLQQKVSDWTENRPMIGWSNIEDPLNELEKLANGSGGEVDSVFVKDVKNMLVLYYQNLEKNLNEKHTRRLTTEQALDELRQEAALAETKFGVTINLPAEKMQRFIGSGEYVGLFDLPDEDINTRVRVLSPDHDHYLRHRGETELMLKPTDPTKPELRSKATVYGTFSSGAELKTGGASQYGKITLQLKPQVTDRTTFTEGDSLSQAGWSKAVWEKMGSSEYAQASNIGRRQIHAHEAPLAKAMMNIDQRRRRDNGQTGGGDAYKYLEAHIFGGVRAEDVDQVVIPQAALEQRWTGSSGEELQKVIKLLQASPEWKDKVHII